MTTHEQRRRTMEVRLAELQARLHEIEEELDAPHSQDWDDLAIEREGDEVMERMGVHGQAEIRMITAALKRMDDGEYGYCAECGSDIASQRLNLVPYTPFCSSCANRHEKR